MSKCSLSIYCSPNEVWAKATPLGMGYMYLIAQDARNDIDIYVSKAESAEGKAVSVSVMSHGEVIRDMQLDSADECKEYVEELYSEYSDASKLTDEEEIEDAITEREDELDQAVMDFLATVLGEGFYDLDSDSNGEIVEDCKEHFLEYIARKFSISIYRPMYLEDEDGTDFYTDTPYENMVFDDEDNPIYK